MSEHKCLLGIQLSKEYKFEFWLPFFLILAYSHVKKLGHAVKACKHVWSYGNLILILTIVGGSNDKTKQL